MFNDIFSAITDKVGRRFQKGPEPLTSGDDNANSASALSTLIQSSLDRQRNAVLNNGDPVLKGLGGPTLLKGEKLREPAIDTTKIDANSSYLASLEQLLGSGQVKQSNPQFVPLVEAVLAARNTGSGLQHQAISNQNQFNSFNSGADSFQAGAPQSGMLQRLAANAAQSNNPTMLKAK